VVLQLNVLSGNGQTPFMWAAIQEQLETMELMRHNDVDMEVHDDNGATALLLAVQHKKPLAMLALLDMGASIDAGAALPLPWVFGPSLFVV